MSVLIKNMKMPTSCAECEWSSLSKSNLGMSVYCKLAKLLGNLDIARKQRIEECPLVEVPTPHGRLIDADSIQAHEMGVFGKRLRAIDEEPTVIEAEE